MKSKYLEAISLLHNAYNLHKGNSSLANFTFYNLYIIFLRKHNLVEFKNNAIQYDRERAETYLPRKIFKWFDIFYIENIKLDSDGNSENSYVSILLIEKEVINKYYKELTDLCISLHLKGNGRFLFDAAQPKELTQLMNFFLPEEKKISVYNPFAGMCSLGVNLSNETEFIAEELNAELAMLAELKFLIFGKKNFKIIQTNSIQSLVEKTADEYDFITFNPPFNLKLNDFEDDVSVEGNKYFSRNNANGLIISASFNKLAVNGKMVFIMPNGFLFSRRKNEKDLKNYLVNHNFISALIKLPTRLFDFSSLVTNIFILEKNRNEDHKIRFIDASEMVVKPNSKQNTLDVDRIINVLNSDENNQFSKDVSTKEVIMNDYDLSVSRYFFEDLGLTENETSDLIKLENLITVIKREKVNEERGKFVKMQDLSKDKTDYTKTFEELEERDLRNNANLLKQDSLLLSLVQVDLRPTVFIKTSKEIYYQSGFILACLVDETKVSLDYLVLELQKEYVQNQLKSRRMGTAVQRISRKDLLETKIVVPSLKEQANKVDIYRNSIINKKHQDFKELVKTYGIDVADENSFLRHQIGGTLKNARGAFKAIKQIINEQIVPKLPGVLDLKKNQQYKATLFDYLNILERDITNINKAVNVVGQELDFVDPKVSKFDLLVFLTNYMSELKNRDSNIFEISLNLDEDLLNEKEVKGIFVSADKEILRRVFDNIIRNAEKHGFNDSISVKNLIEIRASYDFDKLEIRVDFGNTGAPLPSNFSFDAFVRKGSKAGANAGDGVGGWFINEGAKASGGGFSFTDETEKEIIDGAIVTTMEVTLPIELNI